MGKTGDYVDLLWNDLRNLRLVSVIAIRQQTEKQSFKIVQIDRLLLQKTPRNDELNLFYYSGTRREKHQIVL